MLIDLKIVYQVPHRADGPRTTIHGIETRMDLGIRYATVPIDLVEATGETAPLAFVRRHAAVLPDSRECWSHGGRLYGHDEIFDTPEPGGRPSLTFGGESCVPLRFALVENEADVAAAGPARQACIEDARSQMADALIARSDRWRLLRPVEEPFLLVLPPNTGERARKIPSIEETYRFDDDREDESSLAALREDRAFRIDEIEEAKARAKEYGPRVWVEPRYEIHDVSCLSTSLSTHALRLTARDALDACAGHDSPELREAARGLEKTLADPEANAAAICPAVRSFMAAFSASPDLLALSGDPEFAPVIERLGRAHARAQQRIAAGRIPDRDPRALAPEDDLALGRIGS